MENENTTGIKYIFCKTCDMFIDYFKYDSLDDAGHADCKWRYATPDETEELTKECKRHGCFSE